MHVAVVGGDPRSQLNFRGDFMRRLIARGHSVTAVTGGRDDAVERALRADGVTCVSFPLDRTGVAPRQELRSLSSLVRLLRRLRPDLVLAYTPKIIVYAAAAARLADVQVVCALMSGLGTAFTDQSADKRRVNRVARGLLAIALRSVDLVVFQNDDDRRELLQRRVLPRNARTARINGSGVDTTAFGHCPLPASSAVMFLLVARLQREKGIYEFAEAAAILRRRVPAARCVLVGPIDTHPAAIDRTDLERWCDRGDIEWVGPTDDVRPQLRSCHVFVLPSYREGTPRAVLEAMAIGRPIITTDVPGCRETVVDGRNGILVPARVPHGLAAAMIQLAEDADLRATMGNASRLIAEERFEVSKVSGELIRLLEEVRPT